MRYQVPLNKNLLDWVAIGKPDQIEFSDDGTFTTPLLFRNIVATEANPVVINGGGHVMVPPNLSYGMKFEGCKYFRLTGTKVTGGNISVSFDKLTTNFEADNLEISKSGFAGIMAKTDPTFDGSERGAFVMREVKIHDNFIHETGGEGIYIGNSFYFAGVTTNGKLRMPHECENVSVYANKIVNSGWESIQVGCGVRGTLIYRNFIENYGTANKPQQNNGIQLGEGTGGLCWGNEINGGKGNGIIVLGLDNVVFENTIIDAGESGVFADVRGKPIGSGFKFASNTIVNPVGDCFLIYARGVKNELVGNTLIAPGGEFVRISNGSVCSDINNIKMK